MNYEYSLAYDNGPDRFAFTVSSTGLASGISIVNADNFGSPSTGTWHFVLAWHDATANTINISVNNGSANSTSHATSVFDGTSNFALGQNMWQGYMDGRIDEVGFWKRVLTAQERTDLYNAGAGNAYQLGGFILESPTTGKRHRLVTEELP